MNKILENEYFIIELKENKLIIKNTDKEIQEKYDNNDIFSEEEKLNRLSDLISYYYNFWVLAEKENKKYSQLFDLNLVMVEVPWSYYFTMAQTFIKLKKIFTNNLIDTTIISDSHTKKYLDIIFGLYTPVKPVTLVTLVEKGEFTTKSVVK
jgi:hypothetical protein